MSFTPKSEYLFVADPDFKQTMSCGVQRETQRPPIAGGFRIQLDVRTLCDPEVAVPRIRHCFKKMGWNESAVTVSLYKDLKLSVVELIAMRMYTGAVAYSHFLSTLFCLNFLYRRC
eukprot:SAG31_NODE_396_length_16264_cov_17.206496_15_plen_116_part_00